MPSSKLQINWELVGEIIEKSPYRIIKGLPKSPLNNSNNPSRLLGRAPMIGTIGRNQYA
jgi:hypothetical protein